MVQRPHHDGGPAAAVPGPAGKRPPGMAGANPGPAPVCGKIYHLQGVLNRERTKEETSHESYQTPDGRAAGVPDAAVSAAGSGLCGRRRAHRPAGRGPGRLCHRAGVYRLSLRRHGEGRAEKQRPHLLRHRQRIYYRRGRPDGQLLPALRRRRLCPGRLRQGTDGHLVHHQCQPELRRESAAPGRADGGLQHVHQRTEGLRRRQGCL